MKLQYFQVPSLGDPGREKAHNGIPLVVIAEGLMRAPRLWFRNQLQLVMVRPGEATKLPKKSQPRSTARRHETRNDDYTLQATIKKHVYSPSNCKNSINKHVAGGSSDFRGNPWHPPEIAV